MDTLIRLIGPDAATAHWPRLVVIGAGDGQRRTLWSSISALQRDLAEGDPQRAGLLLRASRAAHGASRVWKNVVATGTGPGVWHRYNLPQLDGVFDAQALQDVYPRLARLETQDVMALALADFLGQLDLDLDARADHLLVLDVPGARQLLASAAGHPTLRAFSTVLARDALDPLDGPHVEMLDASLARSAFRLTAADAEWRAYRLDEGLLEREALQVSLAQAMTRCAALEQQVERCLLEAAGSSAAAQSVLADERQALEQERAARLETTQALDDARSAASMADARATQLEQELASLAAELQCLRQEREDDAAAITAERQRTSDTQAKYEAEQASASLRCTVLQDRSSQLERQLAEAQASVQALTKEKQALANERDTAKKTLQEKTQRVQVLEGETADLRTRLDVMAQEIGRAEGQLEVLKELFLQEATL